MGLMDYGLGSTEGNRILRDSLKREKGFKVSHTVPAKCTTSRSWTSALPCIMFLTSVLICIVLCKVYQMWEAIVKYSMCKILDARRNVYMSLFYVIACSQALLLNWWNFFVLFLVITPSFVSEGRSICMRPAIQCYVHDQQYCYYD